MNKNLQMATPITTLPLKTNQETDETELDDPEIQSLIKDFEQNKRMEEEKQMNNREQFIQPTIIQREPKLKEQYINYQQQQNQQQDYNYINTNKIINMDYFKKAVIISIIAYIYLNNDILKIIIDKIPEYIRKYIDDKEYILNLSILIIIYYIFIYYKII